MEGGGDLFRPNLPVALIGKIGAGMCDDDLSLLIAPKNVRRRFDNRALRVHLSDAFHPAGLDKT